MEQMKKSGEVGIGKEEGAFKKVKMFFEWEKRKGA